MPKDPVIPKSPPTARASGNVALRGWETVKKKVVGETRDSVGSGLKQELESGVVEDQISGKAAKGMTKEALAALRKQGPVFTSIEEQTKSLLTRFNRSGADYKGQLSTGWAERGHAVKLEVEVDAGKLICPFLVLAAGATLKAERVKGLFIMLQHQGLALKVDPHGELRTRRPICLMACQGAATAVSASFDARAGVETPDIPDAFKTEEDAKWHDSKKLGNSAIAATYTVKASATAKVGASIKGKWLRVYDPYPLWYDSATSPALARDFGALLGPGEKAAIKAAAGKFFEFARDPEIKKLKPEKKKLSLGDVTTARLYDALDRGLARATDPAHKDDKAAEEIRFHRAALERWQAQEQPKVQIVPDPSGAVAFIDLWGTEGKAEAGVKAEATAEITLLAGVSAEASAGIGYQYKKTAYRFQSFGTYLDNPDTPKLSRNVMATQDTVITYHQVHVEAGAMAQAGLVSKFTDKVTAKGKKTAEKDLHNSMSYVSGVAYWALPPVEKRTKSTVFLTLPALAGSGYAFGQSADVDKLVEAVMWAQADKDLLEDDLPSLKKYDAAQLYLESIAKKLFVWKSQLFAFLKECDDLLRGLQSTKQTSAVLLEASFRCGKGTTFKWETSHQGLEKGLVEALRKGPSATLEAIRLRYRIKDARDQSASKFKLGVSAGIVKVGIELEEVNRAGAEGIVDLHTKWYGPVLASPKAMYEAGVPPVALLCQ